MSSPRRFTVFGALLAFILSCLVCPPSVGTSMAARLTAAHGEVLKRDFVNRDLRDEYGPAVAAKTNDILLEGMQVVTGLDSFAEVTWPNVKARAWANSVFEIRPSQRLVYLTGGELLFRLDKNRKDKNDYIVQTKVLQARIHGTTVIVQATGSKSRIAVLEGEILVRNLVDHSLITLRPGTVLEVSGYRESNARPGKGLDPAMQDICYDSANPVPLFQSKDSRSNLYVSNSQSLRHHPLVESFAEPLDSLPLIEKAMSGFPGFSMQPNEQVPHRTPGTSTLSRLALKDIGIRSVPTRTSYFIGREVYKQVNLPDLARTDFKPEGLIPPEVAVTPPGIPGLAVVRPRHAMPAPVPVFIFPLWDPADAGSPKASPHEPVSRTLPGPAESQALPVPVCLSPPTAESTLPPANSSP